MKVLFIYPNLDGPVGYHVGISVMAALLKKNHHDVRLLHLNESMGYGLDFERIKADVIDYEPALIGISVNTLQFSVGIKIAQFIKNNVPQNIPIVFGGIHPTIVPDEVLSFDCVDMVVVGEGEGAILEIVDCLQNKKDMTHIRNVWLKKNGAIIKNRLREFVDIAALPFMDTQIWNYQKMINLRNGWIDVLVSRGCPRSCAYCFNSSYRELYANDSEKDGPGRYLRTGNYEQLIEGLKNILAVYHGVKCVNFIDDDFLLSSGVVELIRLFKKEINLPFVINAHIDSINAGKLEVLKAGGCDLIRTGIECGNRDIRAKVLGRDVSNEKITAGIGLIKKYGMRVLTYNMIGLPFEKKEDVLETIRLNAQCQPDVVRVFTFLPFPKTGMYDLCMDHGLIDESTDVHGMTFYDASVLNLGEKLRLFLKKVQREFDCYLNSYIENLKSTYHPLVMALEKLDREEYEDKASQENFKETKLRISKAMLSEKKLSCYVFKFSAYFAVLCAPAKE